MRKITTILRLHFEAGLGYRQIATSQDVGYGTVTNYIKRAKAAGVSWPLPPWRIRMTNELRNRFVEQSPEGYVTMQEATKLLGVSRQTVLQRVKNGEIDAVHVYTGKKKGLRINVLTNQNVLFEDSP